MACSRTSSIMAEEKIKMVDLLLFLHFTSIILPCGRNNFKFNDSGGLLSSVLFFLFLLLKKYCNDPLAF